MGQLSKPRTLSPAGYRKLLGELRALIEEGKDEARRAVGYALALTYWKVGQRVVREQLSEHGGYGSGVVQELARELDMDPVTLHRAVAFARAYPSPPEPGLSWVHYRELVGIRDPAERDWYAQRALSEGWTGRALVEAIRQERYQQPGAVASRAAARQLKRPTEATHVYKAWVKRVIDGDTLLLHVDLGFSVIKEQRLRLAAIDAPPLKTPAGRESWRAALDRMGRCEFVVVKTNKVDVHGRYVGHVFYATREMSPAQVFEKGRYLNQELLSEGFAKAV